MGIRECDVINHLRFKTTMTAPSDCNAVLKDGRRLEVFMYQNRPVVELENQFFHAEAVSGFDRFERKPIAAPSPLPEPAVQETDWVEKTEEVAGSNSVQIVERYNSSQLYKRNLVREQHGNLVVEKFIGVDQQNPHVRYYLCRCKCHNREVRASQSDILMSRVTSCQNEKPIPSTVSDARIRNTAGLF